MMDPPRLLDGGTELEQQLLGAAAEEVPSADLSATMLGAITAVPPVAPLPPSSPSQPLPAPVPSPSAPVAVAGAAGLSAGVRGLIATAVLGTIGAVAYLGGHVPGPAPDAGQASAPASATPEAPVPAVDTATDTDTDTANGTDDADGPAPATKAIPPPAEETAKPDPRANTAPPRAPRAPQPSSKDGRLKEELALLDAARNALKAGNGQVARARLAAYRRRFPDGVLRREAATLEARLSGH